MRGPFGKVRPRAARLPHPSQQRVPAPGSRTHPAGVRARHRRSNAFKHGHSSDLNISQVSVMTPEIGETAGADRPTFSVGATPETLRAWLSENRISEVDCAVPDIAGVARGKTMPAEKFVKLEPVHLPISIFHQTITGDYVGFDEG